MTGIALVDLLLFGLIVGLSVSAAGMAVVVIGWGLVWLVRR